MSGRDDEGFTPGVEEASFSESVDGRANDVGMFPIEICDAREPGHRP
jgi:hypothetical protein